MRRSALLLLAVTACQSPQYKLFLEEHASKGEAETSETTATASSTRGTEGSDASDPESPPHHETADEVSDATGRPDESSTTAILGTTGTTGSEPGPPVGDADRPRIVSVTLPAQVHAAGPVPLSVQTEHTGSVRASLDGVDAGELVAAGEGLFTGTLPVHGAVDNGPHDVELVARQGPYEDSRSAAFEVATPEPGTMAWFKAGPAGSRTSRIALTPDGDTIEGGQQQADGVPRPGLRKRSSLTGTELWSVAIDTHEGSVADLAVRPDGHVWVAMNVRKPGDPSPQPRIALFDAAGAFTGIEALGDLGQAVHAIAADPSGGCFAVGHATAGNDLDFAFWRLDAAGVQTLSDAWDYQPMEGNEHKFWDLATDVVIDGDIVWAAGMSRGKHDDDNIFRMRGMIVPIGLHTGEVLTPVMIAPMAGGYTQSGFFGATHHPDGVLVTGYGCDEPCVNYRIETSLYDAAGIRTWHEYDAAGTGSRHGNDVALDSRGRAIVSGSVPQNGVLRGYVFARVVGQKAMFPIFEHWFPNSKPSEALGVLVDAYDRIFPVGYITVNGAPQARIELLHP